ncbi:MAG: hydrogenase formation protein HypD [Bacteroidales bacterium]|nr:hydrogenase formation protein HypD [Bacteroidales bacterium]
MKYIDEFRDKDLIDKLVYTIKAISRRKIRIMEVCGGHTLAIRKFGIPRLLPETIELLSGPGCPVCVTDHRAIDTCIALAKLPDVILTTYGDLIRVPGSASSLDEEKALGADVRLVYSTLDALEIARSNPDRRIIFAGIGFETTTPSSAIAILEAEKQNISNFYLLSMHKLMPPAMAALIEQGVKIDGYIGPGHVTTVAGADMYLPLIEKFSISVVVSGFEPVDLLQSVLMLVKMAEEDRYGLEIQYKRVVTRDGNIKAKEIVDRVFECCDDTWRGLGMIPGSGLAIRKAYGAFDATIHFNVNIDPAPEPKGCICGEVLRGLKNPDQCALFGKACTPASPVGACMVSGEGACQAYYNYR